VVCVWPITSPPYYLSPHPSSPSRSSLSSGDCARHQLPFPRGCQCLLLASTLPWRSIPHLPLASSTPNETQKRHHRRPRGLSAPRFVIDHSPQSRRFEFCVHQSYQLVKIACHPPRFWLGATVASTVICNPVLGLEVTILLYTRLCVCTIR
jgi:hypothetical protein